MEQEAGSVRLHGAARTTSRTSTSNSPRGSHRRHGRERLGEILPRVRHIYAEGQRRYVECVSTYAKQFLERLPRPDYDSIDGLAPALAIRQGAAAQTGRSTVGTVTEVADHLRLLLARVGETICGRCGTKVRGTAWTRCWRRSSRAGRARSRSGSHCPPIRARRRRISGRAPWRAGSCGRVPRRPRPPLPGLGPPRRGDAEGNEGEDPSLRRSDRALPGEQDAAARKPRDRVARGARARLHRAGGRRDLCYHDGRTCERCGREFPSPCPSSSPSTAPTAPAPTAAASATS